MARTKTTKTKTTKTKNNVERDIEVRSRIKEIDRSVVNNYFELADLLHESWSLEYYTKKWGYVSGKSGFEEFINSELDISYRKARYLIDIKEKVNELGLNRDRLLRIGWTKLKDLVTVINDDNCDEWLSKAEDMTTREVTDAIRVSKGKKIDESIKMTIKMDETESSIIEEALNTASEMLENKNKTVALTMICQEWMEVKGAVPASIPLQNQIDYIEKVYNVKLTMVDGSGELTEDTTEDTKEVEEKESSMEVKEEVNDTKKESEENDVDILDELMGETDPSTIADNDEDEDEMDIEAILNG